MKPASLKGMPDQISKYEPKQSLIGTVPSTGIQKQVTKFKALVYLLSLPWTLIIWGPPELILLSFGNSI